jgi:hypothetical protein
VDDVRDGRTQMIFVPYWMLFFAAPIFVLIAVACALAGQWIFVPPWLVFAGLYVWLGFINRRRLREREASTDYALSNADLNLGTPPEGMKRLGVTLAVVVAFGLVFAGAMYLVLR